MADIGEEGFDEEVEEEKIGLVKRSTGLFLSRSSILLVLGVGVVVSMVDGSGSEEPIIIPTLFRSKLDSEECWNLA